MHIYCDKMADYSIDDDKWNDKKDRLYEWFDANPEHSDLRDIVEALLGIGDKQPMYRKKHWASVCSIFAHLEKNRPFSSRRIMPLEVEKALNGYLSTLEAAYASFYEEYGWMLGMTLRPHGKTGRTHYESGDEYAHDQMVKARHFLRNAYVAHVKGDETTYRWDGSFEEDSPDVTTASDDSEGV